MREIIKVKNVSKVYKINKRKSGLFGAVLNLFAPRYEKKIAVSDMNFSIEEGEAVAFIGSNGAGKSTLLKAILGEVEHTGNISFVDMKDNIAKRIKKHKKP